MKVALFLLVTLSTFGQDHSWVLEMTMDLHQEIDYVRSPLILKTPDQTIADREGDCADLSLALMLFIWQRHLGISRMSIWDHAELGSHAVVDYYGRLYDPANGRVWQPDQGWVHRRDDSLDGALLWAEQEGARGD